MKLKTVNRLNNAIRWILVAIAVAGVVAAFVQAGNLSNPENRPPTIGEIVLILLVFATLGPGGRCSCSR